MTEREKKHTPPRGGGERSFSEKGGLSTINNDCGGGGKEECPRIRETKGHTTKRRGGRVKNKTVEKRKSIGVTERRDFPLLTREPTKQRYGEAEAFPFSRKSRAIDWSCTVGSNVRCSGFPSDKTKESAGPTHRGRKSRNSSVQERGKNQP